MEGAWRPKAWMERDGRLLAKTERAQRLQTGTEEVGQLLAVTERNRLIQVETGTFGCSKKETEGALHS